MPRRPTSLTPVRISGIENSGLRRGFVPFAFDQLEQGFVLGGVVLDAQTFAGQFRQQLSATALLS